MKYIASAHTVSAPHAAAAAYEIHPPPSLDRPFNHPLLQRQQWQQQQQSPEQASFVATQTPHSTKMNATEEVDISHRSLQYIAQRFAYEL